MNRPNIVLFYADEHRADALGCAGNQIIQTPNIDRLAQQGVRFTNAWTESPFCRPARASFITGRMPHEHQRLSHFGASFNPEWPTFMRQLQAAGYTTATVGKNHYSTWPNREGEPPQIEPESVFRPTDPLPTSEWTRSFGWDHVVEEFDRYLHTRDIDTPYMRFLREQDALTVYQEAVRAINWRTSQQWDGVTSPLPQSLDLTSFLADEATKWLSAQDGSTPFFLQLSFVAPHAPLMGDPVWSAHYADADIPRGPRQAPTGTTEAWALHLDALRHHSHSELLTDEYMLAAARQYYAMISLIDQRIGDIVALLDHRGLLDSTCLVYAADHGEMMGDHQLMAKMNFYAPSVRIPAIIRPPGGMTGRAVSTPVQARDLPATILDIAGAPSVENSSGRSLMPALHTEDIASRYVFSEVQLIPGLPTFCAVSDGHWRLTIDTDSGLCCELFNLDNDPEENDNLLDHSAHRAVQEHLAEACRQLLAGKDLAPM